MAPKAQHTGPSLVAACGPYTLGSYQNVIILTVVIIIILMLISPQQLEAWFKRVCIVEWLLYQKYLYIPV